MAGRTDSTTTSTMGSTGSVWSIGLAWSIGSTGSSSVLVVPLSYKSSRTT